VGLRGWKPGFYSVNGRCALRLPNCISRFLCGILPYKGSTVTKPAARLALHLNAADRARITRAKLRGIPVSAFVRDTVLREADATMAADLSVTLSAEESHRFLSTLVKPFKPNVRLKKAMAGAARLVRPR